MRSLWKLLSLSTIFTRPAPDAAMIDFTWLDLLRVYHAHFPSNAVSSLDPSPSTDKLRAAWNRGLLCQDAGRVVSKLTLVVKI